MYFCRWQVGLLFAGLMIAMLQVAREFASVVDYIKITVLSEEYTVLPG